MSWVAEEAAIGESAHQSYPYYYMHNAYSRGAQIEINGLSCGPIGSGRYSAGAFGNMEKSTPGGFPSVVSVNFGSASV